MAAQHTNEFGETIIIRWVTGSVKQSIDGAAETTAFALTTESGLDVDQLPDGRLAITYQDGTGTVQRKYSSNETVYV
jgi:hypothetical protein